MSVVLPERTGKTREDGAEALNLLMTGQTRERPQLLLKRVEVRPQPCVGDFVLCWQHEIDHRRPARQRMRSYEHGHLPKVQSVVVDAVLPGEASWDNYGRISTDAGDRRAEPAGSRLQAARRALACTVRLSRRHDRAD